MTIPMRSDVSDASGTHVQYIILVPKQIAWLEDVGRIENGESSDIQIEKKSYPGHSGGENNT